MSRIRPVLVLVPVLLGLLAPSAPADEGRENRTVRVVRKARAAVVSIKTSRRVRSTLFDFLRPRDVDDGHRMPASGLGSGVIFHARGFVITNAHVISEADNLLVEVPDGKDGEGTEYPARPVAVDLANDLAILRLLPRESGELPERFPFLRLADSDDLMLGETVIAVGHPLRLGLTVTRGIISGLDRSLGMKGGIKFDDFIQVDAPINLGNSGGPLFDVTGRWIGVNTAIYNRGFNSTVEGIGFAIPTNRVRALVAKAFRRRIVAGRWIGLELEESDGGKAEIVAVYPKSPAGSTPLRTGDIVVSVDGEPTPGLYEVRMRMISLPPGEKVVLGIERDGVQLPSVTIADEPLPTRELSLRHLGFDADDDEVEGIVISAVRTGSPAADVKLRKGDVIRALGPFRIKNRDDLLRFLQFVQPGDVVDVRIQRTERDRFGVTRKNLKGALEAD